MARLPTPGGDSGNWGEILNEYLLQSHDSAGALKPGVVTKADIGLGNVDNTSDASKPISTAVQSALDDKLDASALDQEVSTLLGDSGSLSRPVLDTAIADGVAAHINLDALPGAELAYAEFTSNWTTTNTSTASVVEASLIPGVITTVIGEGRAVDIEVFCPGIYHSTANTAVIAYLVVNGVSYAAGIGQAGAVSSPTTSSVRSVFFKRRLVLQSGNSYTFRVGVAGGTSGTTTLFGASAYPITLSITRR